MPVCSTTVTLPRDDAKVLLVKRRRTTIFADLRLRRYVGRKDELPPPAARQEEIEKAWQKILDEDLAEHIDNINWNVRSKGQRKSTNETAWSPDLLLTGRRGSRTGTGRLDLSPRIWFRCGSDWCEKIIQDEVKNLSWMASKGLGDHMEVGDLKAAGLSVDGAVPIPKRQKLEDGFNLPDNFGLHISVERRDQSNSACGLLCSIVITQRKKPKSNGICKIGGVFSVKDERGVERLVGVTAAHGILDQFLTADAHTQPEESTASAIPQPGGLRRILDMASFKSRLPHAPSGGGERLLDEMEWEPIRGLYSMNWLGGGWEEALQFQFPFRVSDPERLAPDADFALLELPSVLFNTYRISSGIPQWVEGWLPEDRMANDIVELVIDKDKPILGTLIFEKPRLYLRGRRFPTRKIQLATPLATGCSGCWVVQNRKLCGMIVACYGSEPFAHMITAEKLINDIKKTLGGRIEVSLPEEVQFLEIPGLTIHSPQASFPQGVELPMIRLEDPRPRSSRLSSPQAVKLQKISLLDQLLESVVKSPTDATKYFLPLDALQRILQRRSVELFFRKRTSTENTESICDYIYGTQREDDTPCLALKVFAILLLAEKEDSIIEFMVDGVNDKDLPLLRKGEVGADFELSRNPDKDGPSLKCFKNWSRPAIRNFDEWQWSMLSPFFSQGNHGRVLFYRLHERVVLPWIEDEVTAMGAYSTIRRVRIHPAHHNFEANSDHSFALKQIRDGDLDHFEAELKALRMLGRHPNLLNVLTTFHYQTSYFLLFPYAEGGSLSELCKSGPSKPILTGGTLLWFLEQCSGLAEALEIIHTTKMPFEATNNNMTIGSGSHSDAGEHSIFGRHGDIKPQNILWFPNTTPTPDEPVNGVLKIADFGLTRYHRDSSRSNIPAGSIGMSPTYRAPEVDVRKTISRSYDVWSLACTYLEFASWLLLGPAAYETFSLRRLPQSGDGILEDTFFEVLPPEPSGKSIALVKPSVSEWIASLRAQPACQPVLNDFLSYIENYMLLVDPAKRQNASLIATKLHQLTKRARESNNIYPVPSSEAIELKEYSMPSKDNDTNSEMMDEVEMELQRLELSRDEVMPSRLPHAKLKEPKLLQSRSDGIIDVITVDEYIKETVDDPKKYTRVTLRRTTRATVPVPNPLELLAGREQSQYKDELSAMSTQELADAQAKLLAQLGAVHAIQRARAEKLSLAG